MLAAPPPPFRLEDVKALIVDDYDAIRKAMRRVLSSMGINFIIECSDGRDALKILSKQPDLDLVLCDIYMKKLGGFDVLSYIRNRPIRAEIPVILVTGEANKDDIVRAFDMGADEYLLKPFHAAALISKVNLVLNRFFAPPPLLAKLREGELYLVAKQYRNAYGAFQEALALDPESKKAKYLLALSLFYRQLYNEALEVLIENSIAAPSYYKNYALEADIYLKLELYDKAQAAFEKELSYNPKQPERQMLLAKLFLEQRKDPDAAVNCYRQILVHNSRHPEALLGIARALGKKGDLERALSYVRKHRRHFPDVAASLQSFQQLCLEAGEAEKAEKFFKDEIQAHSSRLDSYVALAKLYMAMKKAGEAQLVLQRLFQIDAAYLEGIKLKADMAFEGGRLIEAQQILEELMTKGPDLHVLLRLAESQQGLKQYQASIQTLHRALFLRPNEALIFFFLAKAYQHSKQPVKAFLLFQASVQAGVQVEACQDCMKECMLAIEAKRR